MPYITGISTGLDGAYKSKTSVFNRSALGYYPVRRGETITVKGFNLKNGNTAPTVKINSNSATLTNAQKAASTISSFAVNIPDAASSGDLEVTVSSIETLNNKTSKTAEYNQEPNGINNNILTDVRKLSVWSFANALTTNNTTIRYPSMRVGKDANQTVGFVYDSGAQAVRMNQGGSDYLIDWSFTQWYATSVAVDNAGRMYGSGMNGDSGGSGNQSWGDGGYANYGFYAWNTKNYPGRIRDPNGDYANPGSGTYLNHQAYSSGRKKVALENSSADENGNNFSATRVMNPKIVATSGTGTTSTGYVYTVYYDSIFDRVGFRYGSVSGTIDSNNSLTFSGGLGNHGNKNSGSAANLQIIAGTGASGTNTIDGGTAVANTNRAGEYVAVGVIPKAKISTAAGTVDGAVVAWYDASNQRLLFSYNKDPTSTANAANWGTNTQVIDDDFAGWYVDMAVDPDGNVHIAYYGASNGDLKYAYLPIAKDANGKLYTQGAQVCTVDSYLSVGTNISIDIPTATETVYKADGSTTPRYIPRISYFMSAFTKTKYSVRTASLYKLGNGDVITDGVENDKFTGNWEVMSVPTNQIPLDYTIGVGLKNNDAGIASTLLGYGTTTNLQTAALQ